MKDITIANIKQDLEHLVARLNVTNMIKAIHGDSPHDDSFTATPINCYKTEEGYKS